MVHLIGVPGSGWAAGAVDKGEGAISEEVSASATRPSEPPSQPPSFSTFKTLFVVTYNTENGA